MNYLFKDLKDYFRKYANYLFIYLNIKQRRRWMKRKEQLVWKEEVVFTQAYNI
jgi:hypothetical protein